MSSSKRNRPSDEEGSDIHDSELERELEEDRKKHRPAKRRYKGSVANPHLSPKTLKRLESNRRERLGLVDIPRPDTPKQRGSRHTGTRQPPIKKEPSPRPEQPHRQEEASDFRSEPVQPDHRNEVFDFRSKRAYATQSRLWPSKLVLVLACGKYKGLGGEELCELVNEYAEPHQVKATKTVDDKWNNMPPRGQKGRAFAEGIIRRVLADVSEDYDEIEGIARTIIPEFFSGST